MICNAANILKLRGEYSDRVKKIIQIEKHVSIFFNDDKNRFLQYIFKCT